MSNFNVKDEEAKKPSMDGLVKSMSVLLKDNECAFNLEEQENQQSPDQKPQDKKDSEMIDCLMQKLTSKKFLVEKETKNSFYLVDNENMKIKKLKEHGHSASLNDDLSPLQYERIKYQPTLPKALASEYQVLEENHGDDFINKKDYEEVKKFLKNLHNLPILNVKETNNHESFKGGNVLKIGIILSGGPAPGGHNVISGIYDYAKRYNEQSQVIGFLGGIDGLYSKNYVTITDSLMNRFRNLGGFNMLWSGRGKVRNKDDLISIENIVAKLKINGLVIIGGDGSNSNAALISEYFAERKIPISIIGIPKTIDGDLKSEAIEISFGFDTATKTYSEVIGNLCTDVKTGNNVYHVVRVMGRSASHVVLECALQTRPNIVLIGEEVEKENLSLKDIVSNIVNTILKRRTLNKNYGVILIPEGLIEFVPEMKILIGELNVILKEGPFDANKLKHSREVWDFLPSIIQDQLLMDRESTGYIQVGKIATERLIIVLVESELAKLKDNNLNIQFMAHYLGYEGRCAIPSNFDCNYCYALGYNAALLIDHKKTGYMSIIQNLEDSYANWIPAAIPFLRIMHVNRDNTGKEFPAVKRYLVDLNSPLFNVLKEVRNLWSLYDLYRSPGPIQFNGHLSNSRCYTVKIPTKNILLCQNSDDLQLIINLANKKNHAGGYSNGGSDEEEGDNQMDLSGISVNSQSKGNELGAVTATPKGVHEKNLSEDMKQVGDDSGIAAGKTILPDLVSEENGNASNVENGLYEQHCSSYKSLGCMSELQTSRLYNKLMLPELCTDLKAKVRAGKQYISSDPYTQKQILSNYPHMSYENKFQIQEIFHDKYATPISFEIKIGIVFLSRQAPGAMNVLCGLYQRLKLLKGVCIAFYGLYGLLNNKYIIIDDDNIAKHMNQGGLELTGNSPEHSLFDKESRNKVCETVTNLQLNGLVMPGSNVTITEAALLAEYFLEKKIPTSVVGIPLTGSNNLIHELIETCVGFDSSTKVYASLIGNVLTDAVSMPKYWHFIRLMGRSPSHEVLECALQTHPNMVIISEEYGAADKTLWRVVQDIADVVCARAELGKNYGTVLIPDALLMHLPHMKILLSEISDILNDANEKGQLVQARKDLVNLSTTQNGTVGATSGAAAGEGQPLSASPWVEKLTPWSLALLKTFPQFIIKELLHVDLRSMRFEKLETEQLLLQMVKEELHQRKQKGKYSGSFMGLTHFFGYQGRSSLPSEFDCKLAYSYGHAASIVIESGLTGYIVSIRGLCGNIKDWKLFAIPFISLMKILPRGQDSKYLKSASKGDLPVIPSAPVDLNGKAYRSLKIALQKWQMEDRFCNPGPIQFEGNASNYYNRILFEEQSEYFEMLRYVECYANILKDTCRFGVSADYLKNVFVQLCGMLVLAYKPNDILSNMPYIGSIEDYYDWENQRKRMD
ncbi:6-phosphofructokinase, putative [Plasmodium knowlesi strain H]|uniref:Probable ATP-dependent 6-phosphofructokinase n=3 Tax=Plasmodium knowlesi TaxID=5850 RepID=A0A5K1VP37_PLAKH|nr:ATP-dependent 6-phosphofructokinase, putative [Plasmodium knowlesi strain H]OTN67315.1 putative ATP-dependent 6-phosphofructokinase [Plasmodium knowlesi]CAA9987425.1 ATP-dependent 6-phosphofructokinase, putative [Plasmodium knowlesi strain H]SBO23270.1 6-phosphofructokinase, putative [Plasmodium knowlesi strain H]SBO24238.1 6-phosphofructokinase, putative [Plasmodium knowlesi strain H]VVS76899.1 ATP-dependent 6-phosphofructokinase, putative [Plasmodium knowlesi strain H]|eukprot:XP_002258426.1 6-phosphofructokinase, putative [Plasmodium knowlesi strain H]